MTLFEEKTLFEEERTYLMHTYNRYHLALKSGNGCSVYDFAGKEYLDFLGGIACVPLGHNHPAVKEAIHEQTHGLTNVSNLFYTENQIKLAKTLVQISGLQKCFLSNSGTEANECAIKLAIATTKKHAFIACKNAFHGRTFGSLSATHDKKYKAKFKPLVSSFTFVDYGDAEKIKKAITEKTAAVILEPIQGEAGVIVPPASYLKDVLAICEQKGILLILDEVQCGNGRTGTYFEYLSHGIKPHIVTTAKGLANGLPIGATLARGLDFEPGDHASTFGGNSFCAAVALSVIETITKKGLMENAVKQGNRIQEEIRKMNKKEVREIRGKGLMIGIEFKKNAKEKVSQFMQKGIIINIAHEKTMRLLPPLIISDDDVKRFISVFDEVVQ